MALFGELVIPSSRVLWDDEEEYEQFTSDSSTAEWQGQATIPAEITNLLIIETKKLSPLARSCLRENSQPICTLPPAVSVYKLIKNNFLVVCEEGKDVIAGEVTEKLVPWIEKATNIVAVTSNCAAMFQKNNSEELPNCFIKSLTTGKVGQTFWPKLEAPNLATGISAGVLSYCQHMGLSASLYVCYLDSRPLDSTTAAPIIYLLKKLNIPTEKSFSFKPTFKPDSNLYM